MKKQNLPIILLSLLLGLLLLGYFMKNNLNNFIAEKLRASAGTEVILSGEQWVDSLFNYTKNGENFEFTLLQFKSTGCTICKQMEPVLAEIKSAPKIKVNVVELNVMNPNSQNVMQYFGISAVPTQLVLNNEGVELFRNYGFIAASELKLKFHQQ
ncbi:thioredoxin family protein [Mariniphaga sp.]|uniref:thioredoxin family protein n=1 Tax=Mariniphaga sp. TaxID=1954475 RepID=UPI003562567F